MRALKGMLQTLTSHPEGIKKKNIYIACLICSVIKGTAKPKLCHPLHLGLSMQEISSLETGMQQGVPI